MDKHTLSNYGFLLVATILVAALLAVLSPVTPFGDYVRSSINEVVDNYIEKTNVEEVENKKEDITPDSNNTDTIWKITINLLYEDGKQIREPIEMEIKHGETLNVQEKLPKIDGYAPTNIPKENTIVNNETYNIIYVKNLYSIEYITNGGTILSTKPTSYLYGETIDLPSNVIKEGYYFAGWYQKSDFSGSRIDEITPQIKGDLVLYARWERNAYTITYFSNGKEITNIESKYKLAFYGESVVLPILSAQGGKNFGGWYTNKYFEGNNVVSTPQYPKENLTYYAFWTNEGYSIRYETNGGTFNGSYPTIYMSGQNIKLPTNITKNGYELVGWYTDSSYTTLVKEILPTDYGNKVFYAKWKYGEYNITYDLQGGTSNGTLTNKYIYNPDTSPLTYNNNISKPGYTFVGWKDVDLGTIETGVSAGRYGDIVLIAQYISRTYEITYNGNGGTPQTTKWNIRYGEPYGNGPTVIKNGYDFTGWYTSASGGGKINSTSTYALTNNQTLYAHWTPATYNITYIKDGGEFTTSPTTTYKFGVGLTLPTNITKDKYTFGGWYLDSNLTTAITNISTTTFGDITVYAKWIPATYSITYNTDGGTMTSNNYPTRYTYGVGVETLPTPQKTGYNFTGWKDNNGTIIDKISSSDYGNKTLTATYQLKEYVINIVLVDSSGNYILNNNSEKFIFKQSIEYGKLYSYNADNFTNLFGISDKYYHEAFTFQKQQSDAISNNIFEEEIKLTCYNWRILYVEEYYNNVKYEDFNFDASYKYRQPQHGTATLEIPQYQNDNMWILKDNGLGGKTVEQYVGNGGNTLKIYYDPYTFNIIWVYDSSVETPTATLPTTYCYGQIPFDVPLFTKTCYVFDGYTVTNGTATKGTTKYSITPSSPDDVTLKPKWVRSEVASAHNLTSSITKNPTCTATGIRTYTCKDGCGYSYNENIPALGHGNYTYSGAVAATCTNNGKYNDTFCGRCGVKTATGSTIAALGHSYSNTVYYANCTSGGYTNHKCTRCGYAYNDSWTNALGHSYYASSTTAATCTSQGYTTYTCNRCWSASYNDNFTSALGHLSEGTAGCSTRHTHYSGNYMYCKPTNYKGHVSKNGVCHILCGRGATCNYFTGEHGCLQHNWLSGKTQLACPGTCSSTWHS